jgi:hypothetical protein
LKGDRHGSDYYQRRAARTVEQEQVDRAEAPAEASLHLLQKYATFFKNPAWLVTERHLSGFDLMRASSRAALTFIG